MTRALAAILIAVAAFSTAPGIARSQDTQDTQGTVNLRASVEQQIAQLEALVGGDAPASHQVVMLQWLIDLYTYLKRWDDVEHCYDRILAYFPADVGTLDAYGRFLMETRHDYARADSVLYDAYQWGKARDARSLDMGTTFSLRAELAYRQGDYESAIRRAETAVVLRGEDRAVDALRVRARSLKALEHWDSAADAYLDLIGVDGGANHDDINDLETFVGHTTKYDAQSIHGAITDAIAARHKRTKERIEREGGSLVTLTGDDGVRLEGTLRRAKGPGAVLFVHDVRGRRSEYTPYAQLLYIDKISSLAIDLRGHGGSRADSLLSYDAMTPAQRDRLPDDVVTAFHYLQGLGLDESHIAIVAEGVSCALVEKALHRGHIAAPVVYLSPVFSDQDPEVVTAIGFHPERPALILASDEDIEALRSLQVFKDTKSLPGLKTKIYKDAGHGVDVLRRSTEALDRVQRWLRATVGTPPSSH